MRSALITGDEGFIGRHLAARLDADGYYVVGFDVKHGRDCREVFRSGRRFDLVIHCAATAPHRAAIDTEPLKVATDIGLDSEFFQYVARTKPDRAVYFSSSAAYPVMFQALRRPVMLDEGLIDPAMPRNPDAIYGWAKLTGERTAALVNADLDCVHVFRPFSGYGTDQDLVFPFPAFIDRAKRRMDPFEIWGTGTQVRDWVHVDDVVNTVLAVLPHRPSDVGPVNIATGRGTSFLVLADKVTQAAGYSPAFKTLPDRPAGVHYRVGEPSHMAQFWRPKVTLEEGIARALQAD